MKAAGSAQRRGVHWLVAILLAAHVWMAASVSSNHSVTTDEIVHLAAGYSYWTRNDYRLHPENGNLPQRLGALPLLLTDARFPEPDLAWRVSDAWKIGYDFLYTQGNDASGMLGLGRAAMAPLGALAGLCIFLWSRKLWGTSGGLVSLALWCFCPNALAHAGLVTSDMAATAAFLGAISVSWWAMQRITLGRVLAAGVSVGLLALSKFSAPLLVPVVVVLALVRAVFGPPRLQAGTLLLRNATAKLAVLTASQLAVATLALGVLWSAYGWRHSIYPEGQKPGMVRHLVGWDDFAKQGTVVSAIVRAACDSRLIPEAYAYGFVHSYKFSRTRRAFLNGEYRSDGWIGFFPYTAWVKTPPAAWLLLLGASLALALVHRRSRALPPADAFEIRQRLYLAAPLLVFGYVYACSALSSGLNIGHRHILPLYPLLYILLGAACPIAALAHRRGKIVVFALVGAFAAESFAARPGYLSYFNLFDGGPRQAYRHVVDSSLDWGQDLPALRSLLARRPSDMPVFLSYFGSAEPLAEGIKATRIADEEFDWQPRSTPAKMTPGVYCISATMLQQVYSRARGPWDTIRRARLDALEKRAADPLRPLSRTESIELEHHRFARLCAWLRSREPDARAAHSILVYVVAPAEFAAAMGETPSPSAP